MYFLDVTQLFASLAYPVNSTLNWHHKQFAERNLLTKSLIMLLHGPPMVVSCNLLTFYLTGICIWMKIKAKVSCLVVR